MDDLAEKIIAGLSELILLESVRLASEWRDPRRSGDEMDDFIKESKEKLKNLREIREHFERTFTGAPE